MNRFLNFLPLTGIFCFWPLSPLLQVCRCRFWRLSHGFGVRIFGWNAGGRTWWESPPCRWFQCPSGPSGPSGPSAQVYESIDVASALDQAPPRPVELCTAVCPSILAVGFESTRLDFNGYIKQTRRGRRVIVGREAIRGRCAWISIWALEIIKPMHRLDVTGAEIRCYSRFAVRELALTSWKKRPHWQIWRFKEGLQSFKKSTQ